MSDFSVNLIISLLSPIVIFGLFLLYQNRALIVPYYFLNKKEKTDIKLHLIEKSYQESEKLHALSKELNKILEINTSVILENSTEMTPNQISEKLEEISEQFERFLHHFQHLCVLILSGIADDTVFKYKYIGIIKMSVENNYIEMVHEILDKPFNQEDYFWLEDTYKLAIRKKLINKC